MKFFGLILLAYLVLTVLMFIGQRGLLYLSDRYTPAITDAPRGMQFWPNYEQYRGFVSTETAPQGTVIVFHGNAGSARDRMYYHDALVPLGYRVLLAEYPGYGGRAGKPREEVFKNDAISTVKQAYQDFGAPLYLWGESMGCGVVAAISSEVDEWADGLVLLTPWANLPDLAQSIYWFLPARWLVLDHYDNVANLKNWQKSIAVLLAAEDEVIPVQHGQRLYDSLTAPKRLWLFEQAGHNSWPVQANATWWREVMQFIKPTT